MAALGDGTEGSVGAAVAGGRRLVLGGAEP
jgi:hypothetical protein